MKKIEFGKLIFGLSIAVAVIFFVGTQYSSQMKADRFEATLRSHPVWPEVVGEAVSSRDLRELEILPDRFSDVVPQSVRSDKFMWDIHYIEGICAHPFLVIVEKDSKRVAWFLRE